MSTEAQLSDDIINDLHLKKAKAINALDFETAEHFQHQIIEEKAKKAQSQFEVIKRDASQAIQKILSQQIKKMEIVVEENRKLDARLYSKYQVLFDEAQEDHVHQLVELEKDRGFALLQVSDEEVPQQTELLEQAKHEAYLSNFENAKALRDQAREIGERTLAARQQEIESEFAMKKSELIENQKKELDDITALHSKETAKLREESEARIEKLNYEFQNSIQILQDQMRVRILALDASDEAKQNTLIEIIDNISNSVEEFQSTPQISAPRTRSEQMRLTEVAPSQAAVNRDAPPPSAQTLRTASRKRATASTATGLKPVKGSTGFLSRQKTPSTHRH